MSSRSAALARRRESLIDRAEMQRATLDATIHGLRRELAVADAVIAVVRRVHRHRVVFGAAAAGLMLAPVAARTWLRRAMWAAPLALEGYRLAMALGRSRRTSPPASPPAA